MDNKATSTYKDASLLAKSTQILFFVCAVLAALMIWSTWRELELLKSATGGQGISDAAAAVNDSRQAFIGLVYFVLSVSGFVVLLRWISRANRNARALGASDMRFTPGWSVGWFFVPIMNLFRPYQVVRELLNVSGRLAEQGGVRYEVSLPIGLWWMLWILSGLVDQMSLRMTLRAADIQDLIYADWVSIIGSLVGIPALLLAVTIVSEIQGLQMARAQQKVHLGDLSGTGFTTSG